MDGRDEIVRVDRSGAVGHIRLNRPDTLNVLDEPLADALLAALQAAASDPAVRALVLSGAGRSFMAGGDLARFRADLDGAAETAAGLIHRFHAIMRLITGVPKLVVAAIQGPVAGGGVGLALACDWVVAAADTTLLSAYTKLGTSPDGGTTWSLTHLLGPRRAMEFMLLNERLDAATAERLGLVNAVVPDPELLPHAMSIAARLADGPAGAQAAVKRLVRSAGAGGFDAQLDLERASFTTAAATPDFREGIAAFFERRPARFGA